MRPLAITFVVLSIFAVQRAVAQQPQPQPQPPAPFDPKSAAAHNAASNAQAEAALQRQADSITARGTMLLRQAFDRTRSARTSTDYSAIIDMCQQALSQGVNNQDVAYADRLMAWAHNRRGEAFAEAKRQSEALADFTTALAMDANNWRAYHNRGVCLASTGSYDEAMNDFHRALELNQSYANTWFNRAELRYQRGDFEEAIKDYTEALRRAPSDGSTYNSRGHAYYRLGQVKQAGADFNKAVELSPANPSVWINRGDYFTNQGDYAQAARDFREAIRVNPQSGRAYQSAAWLMATCPDEKFRDPNMAIETAHQAVRIDGKNFRYLDTLAAALANAGRYDEAITIQKQAVQGIQDADSGPYEERLKLYIDKKPYRSPPAQVANVPGGSRG